MERVASDQDGVEHDSEAPDVGGFPRVALVGIEDLWADVGWAAMFVAQQVIGFVFQYDCILEAFKLYPCSEREERKVRIECEIIQYESFTDPGKICNRSLINCVSYSTYLMCRCFT